MRQLAILLRTIQNPDIWQRLCWGHCGLVAEDQTPKVFQLQLCGCFPQIRFVSPEVLVGGLNPSEKIGSQLGWWNSQLNGQIKNAPNHQPQFCLSLVKYTDQALGIIPKLAETYSPATSKNKCLRNSTQKSYSIQQWKIPTSNMINMVDWD